MEGSLAMGITEVNIRNIQLSESKPRAMAHALAIYMNKKELPSSISDFSGLIRAFF
jgi:hypothetical protein